MKPGPDPRLFKRDAGITLRALEGEKYMSIAIDLDMTTVGIMHIVKRTLKRVCPDEIAQVPKGSWGLCWVRKNKRLFEDKLILAHEC